MTRSARTPRTGPDAADRDDSAYAMPQADALREPALNLRDLFHTLTEGHYPSEQRLEQMLDRMERVS